MIDQSQQNDWERESIARQQQVQGYGAELHRLADSGTAYAQFCANFIMALSPPPVPLTATPLPNSVSHVIPLLTREQAYELLKLVLAVMAK